MDRAARGPTAVQLPFAMLPVLHFAASKEVMGRFASSPLLFAVSFALALVVMGINVMLIVEFLQDPPTANVDDEQPEALPPWVLFLVLLCGLAYFGLCLRLMWTEVVALGRFLRRKVLGQQRATTIAEFRADALVDDSQGPPTEVAADANGGATRM